jgi:hypothetical protein
MKKNLNSKRARLSPKQPMLKQFAVLVRQYEKLMTEFEAFPSETQKQLKELKSTSALHLTEAYRLASCKKESLSGGSIVRKLST